jgi:hypothetical protein
MSASSGLRYWVMGLGVSVCCLEEPPIVGTYRGGILSVGMCGSEVDRIERSQLGGWNGRGLRSSVTTPFVCVNTSRTNLSEHDEVADAPPPVRR